MRAQVRAPSEALTKAVRCSVPPQASSCPVSSTKSSWLASQMMSSSSTSTILSGVSFDWKHCSVSGRSGKGPSQSWGVKAARLNQDVSAVGDEDPCPPRGRRAGRMAGDEQGGRPCGLCSASWGWPFFLRRGFSAAGPREHRDHTAGPHLCKSTAHVPFPLGRRAGTCGLAAAYLAPLTDL